MTIYSPRVFLTNDDKELLSLLASLLIECQPISEPNNRYAGSAHLSNVEALRLIQLLEDFVGSKRFIEGAYFVEMLLGKAGDPQNTAREIYLSWRRRLGRSRAVATVQWENFVSRLGLRTADLGGPPVWYRASARPMDFEYFLRMERKLADSADLTPQVRELVVAFVSARSQAVEKLRHRETFLERGAVSAHPKALLSDLKSNVGSELGYHPISNTRLSAVLTIVLDFSTLFTTRDWSVAGFISTIAAAVPPAVSD